MFRISPLDHWGIQTRDRVFIMLTRSDVHNALGPFPAVQPTTTSTGTLRDVLEPIPELNIAELAVDREYVRRPAYRHRPRNANACYYTGRHGPHNYAYDLDGKAPTLTSKPTIVFDDRVGQFRKLSVREMLRVQGMPESPIPAWHLAREHNSTCRKRHGQTRSDRVVQCHFRLPLPP